MIILSRWHPDRTLIDPFCGSGTIPLEALMIALNIAPGLKRSFVSETWPNLPPSLWNKARSEALGQVNKEREIRIIGSDISADAITLSRYSARQAGLLDKLHFVQKDVKDLSTDDRYGFIICNPPYGERLGEAKEVEGLYRTMGKVFSKLDTWSKFVLTSHMDFEKLYGKRADKKRKLYNGRLLCYLYQYLGPRKPRPRTTDDGAEEIDSQQPQ